MLTANMRNISRDSRTALITACSAGDGSTGGFRTRAV
jgi:hypothetical protein